jgi:hypothetical protein
MAFSITAVVLQRLERQGRIQLLTSLNHGMKLIQHDRHSFHIELKAHEDVERPPMATIPEYQARRAELHAGLESSQPAVPAR